MKSPQQAEPKIATYLHAKGRQLGLPIAGNFELTARCNFNCPMCYVHMTPQQIAASGRKELTAQQWLSLAQQARDMGMVFVLLTGGEPLTRPDFFEIYRGMKQLGLLISINTNGSLLQGQVLEQFIADPPSRFNISLYGGSNATYEAMCGTAAFDRVTDAIRALRKTGVDVSLNLSITPMNHQDIELIYQKAVELDVNVKASSYMYPSIRVNGSAYGCGNRLDPETSAAASIQWDLLRFGEETFAQRAKNMEALIRESEGCPMEEGEGVACRAGSSAFWINWDGTMTPCGMMTTPVVHPLTQGFEAAWQQLRGETAKIRLPAQCGSCDHKNICGVCAAVCHTETGRFDGVPEYVCQRARWITELTRQAAEKRGLQ